jgi:hypothetical protein
MVVFKHHLKKIHVDGELGDLKKSVDEESKVPSVTTPGVWMTKKALKTLDNNNGI